MFHRCCDECMNLHEFAYVGKSVEAWKDERIQSSVLMLECNAQCLEQQICRALAK